MHNTNIAILTKSGERELVWRYNKAMLQLGYSPKILPLIQPINNLSQYQFILHIDDGDFRIYPKFGNIPNIYIATDTTLSPNRCAIQAKFMDGIFYAQRKSADSFGNKLKHWLPNAHDHITQKPNLNSYERIIDVSSVGDYIKRPDRHKLYKELQSLNRKVLISNNVEYHEMLTFYNLSKIVINPMLGDINFRTFESMGQGALCLTHDNRENGSSELGLQHNNTCVFYERDEDVPQIIEDLLSNPNKLTQIANNGLNLIHRQHTFTHRSLELISVINQWFNLSIPLLGINK